MTGFIHGESVPVGWFLCTDDRPKLYLRNAYNTGVLIQPTEEGEWAVTRPSYGREWAKLEHLFHGPSVAACAAWWAIEESNEPAPVTGFDYANNSQVQAYTKLVGGEVTTLTWSKP